MPSIFSSNYLSRKPVETAVAEFAQRFTSDHIVIDLGCGNKPYAHYFQAEYIGVDQFPGTKADIITDAWETGLPDTSVDAVILNQSLEHIPETQKTVDEVWRILKPGGLCLVTVPQTMRNHSTPIPSKQAPYQNFDTHQIPYWNDDYWRFTKFGLIHTFKRFEVQSACPNQSYLSTLVQLWNYYLASFNLGVILAPLYFINNIVALGLDKLSSFAAKRSVKYRFLIHEGLSIDITLIAKKEY